MICAIIDYDSGNLRSAEKSFARMAAEQNAGQVVVTNDPAVVAKADRIVLPGVGAFADCYQGLMSKDDLFATIQDKVTAQGTPFLGICVGMQMMATVGREHGKDCAGFDWIGGEVVDISPDDPELKVPHMGWNDLATVPEHPVFKGISQGDHAYFVHSYHVKTDNDDHCLATVNYGGPLTAAIGRDNILGTQFHPEKSQATGLRMIRNFLTWTP